MSDDMPPISPFPDDEFHEEPDLPVEPSPPPVSERPVEDVPLPEQPVEPEPTYPFRDMAARAIWTLLEAGVGALVVWISQLDVGTHTVAAAFLGIFSAGLASVGKSFFATKVGNPNTVTFD
jgi:hypothetical protein